VVYLDQVRSRSASILRCGRLAPRSAVTHLGEKSNPMNAPLRLRSETVIRQIFVWLTLVVAGLAQAGGKTVLEVGRFSAAAPGTEFPDNWKPLMFKDIPRHTVYTLVRDGGVVVVKATSEGASSGLVRQIAIDPREYPILQWRWKITNVLQKGDVTRKDGDDYPARLYITFEYDSSKAGLLDMAKYEAARLFYGDYPPLAAINYIWTSKEPKGLVISSPYTDRARMLVLESGPAAKDTWVTEERNIVEDYRLAFGDKTGTPMISGVAIMTDTDNTGESATAYFGDIVFKPLEP
jgi:Protein of unknown function (DUF3047)